MMKVVNDIHRTSLALIRSEWLGKQEKVVQITFSHDSGSNVIIMDWETAAKLQARLTEITAKA